MAFTKEEFEAWRKAKSEREFRPVPEFRHPLAASCIHCGRAFGLAEGTITDEFAICDACDGD